MAWPVSMRRRGAFLGGWGWDGDEEDEEEEEGDKEVAGQVGKGGGMTNEEPEDVI